jgi:hypothetical protein
MLQSTPTPTPIHSLPFLRPRPPRRLRPAPARRPLRVELRVRHGSRVGHIRRLDRGPHPRREARALAVESPAAVRAVRAASHRGARAERHLVRDVFRGRGGLQRGRRPRREVQRGRAREVRGGLVRRLMLGIAGRGRYSRLELARVDDVLDVRAVVEGLTRNQKG